jgi:glycosyltransferase involved in cell wall biosynthesis
VTPAEGRSGSSRVDVVVYTASAGPLYGGQGMVGGAELQSVYIARALAEAGFGVRHVVADAAIDRTPEGVEIQRLPRGYGVRGVARRRAIVEGLRKANGRLYIQRPAGIETGFAGMYARLARRRFVFSASSDADFMSDRERLMLLGGNLEARTARFQYALGLKCADALVVQTEHQARMAEGATRHVPQVIPSFCSLGDRRSGVGDYVLWIGALVGVKDPLSYVELAERVPEVRFLMVAKERDGWQDLADEVRSRAAGVANLELRDSMPREDALDLYPSAIAVVSTSEYEGFSNVFLEAWSRGVPALSLRVDPDGVIGRLGLGEVAGGSVETLAATVRRFVEQPAHAEKAGDAGYRYVAERHAPGVVGRHWAELVKRLLAE